MTKKEKALLIGMSLGDGSIKKSMYKNKFGKWVTYGVFSVTHQAKQKEYLVYKATLLSKILKCKPLYIAEYTSKTSYGEVRYFKCWKQHPYFRVIRKWLYPRDKKFISPRILRYLTPHALAIWYMDDGGLSKTFNKKYNKYSSEMRISTYFSEKEADAFIEYFKDTWDITAKKRFCKKTKSFYMAFNSVESVKFEALIKPYILPYFSYKLPSNWNPRALDTQKSDDIV